MRTWRQYQAYLIIWQTIHSQKGTEKEILEGKRGQSKKNGL